VICNSGPGLSWTGAEFVGGMGGLVPWRDMSGNQNLTPNVQQLVEVAEKFFNIFALNCIQMKKCILGSVTPWKDLKITGKPAIVSPALQGGRCLSGASVTQTALA